MTNIVQRVIGGVDTHKDSHHAAVITDSGKLLDDQRIPASGEGHRALLAWLQSFGDVLAIGIEGTSSYGAELTRVLMTSGIALFEVNRPDRSARRRRGKSDQLDFEQAARSVLAGTATAIPKAKSGSVEDIRTLRVTRSTAEKAKTQAMNALQSILVTAPTGLREELIPLRARTLINRCSQLRPETTTISDLMQQPDRMLTAATKTALRDLARRWLVLDREAKDLSRQIALIVEHVAPELTALHRRRRGDRRTTTHHRWRQLRTHQHRVCLRQTLWSSATTSEQRQDQRAAPAQPRRRPRRQQRALPDRHHQDATSRTTRAYITRRTAEGLSKREIIRCLSDTSHAKYSRPCRGQKPLQR